METYGGINILLCKIPCLRPNLAVVLGLRLFLFHIVRVRHHHQQLSQSPAAHVPEFVRYVRQCWVVAEMIRFEIDFHETGLYYKRII